MMTSKRKTAAVQEQMTKEDVQKLLKKAIRNMGSIRAVLHEVKCGKGYLHYGCKSMNEFISKKIDFIGKSHAYRLLSAANIEHELRPNSPIGEIKESVLRPLFLINSNEDRKSIWKTAMKLAKNDKKKQPTAKHVKKAIEKLQLSAKKLTNRSVDKKPSDVVKKQFGIIKRWDREDQERIAERLNGLLGWEVYAE